MTGRPKLLAFIDESGQRSMTKNSSDYFVLAAVLMPERRRVEGEEWLARIRTDLRRQQGQVLHWKQYVAHRDRLHVSQEFGRQGFARASAVVACKRHLTHSRDFTEDHAYMFAFRLLLERMSWLADERNMELEYTLGHVRGFAKSKLREYEATLRAMDRNDCKVRWDCISNQPSRIDRPENAEMLQLSDVIASAIGAAFNQDEFGNTEQRYLQAFANRFYRGRDDRGRLTSYGLKMLPWSEPTRAAHPWVAAL
jgi:hypothetical protein